LFEPDVVLEVLPGDSYLPDQSRSDDYRCFLVDWSSEDPRFLTGFRADPGNRNVAHHVVVYAVVPHMADRFRELEAEEAGAGYQCFGGALPDRLGDRDVRAAYEAQYPDGVRELSRANFWLAHWAPGMEGHVFPAGTGIRLDPGMLLVVQMHYYSSDAAGERDTGSQLGLTTTESVERPAFHLAQTRGDWLGANRNETLVIPPGVRRTYGMRDNLGDLLGYVSDLTHVDPSRIKALEIHSANLHMHAFGHSGRVVLTHDTGQRETLLSIPRWDLAWQRDFTFRRPKILVRDSLEDAFLEVECTYENPGAETVYGGYGSMEEMCFNFSYIAVQEEDSRAGDERPGLRLAPLAVRAQNAPTQETTDEGVLHEAQHRSRRPDGDAQVPDPRVVGEAPGHTGRASPEMAHGEAPGQPPAQRAGARGTHHGGGA
jgi:hypothetical protein